MTIERYALGTLKRRIRNEFALEDVPEVNELIQDKVNEAYLWICRLRKNWYWQLVEHILDIPASTTALLSFVAGSRTATLTSGTVVKRDVLLADTSYIVIDVSGNVVTLDRQWMDTTDEFEVTVVAGYLPLPEDFIKVETSLQVATLAGETLRFFDTQRFQVVRRSYDTTSACDRIYTVLPDPCKEDFNVRYFTVFPYIQDQMSIALSYYRIPQPLLTDVDEPIIPLEDRAVLLYAALWFVAVAKGFDKAPIYQNQALDDLRRMSDHADENDTMDLSEDDPTLTLDMSDVRNHGFPFDSDYSPGIV